MSNENIVNVIANNDGVIMFERISDMFNELNDYPADQGQFEFKDEPLSVRVSHMTVLCDDEYLEEYNEMAFIYTIYKTFTHTLANRITVEAYPMYMNINTTDKLYVKDMALKATVTREEAKYALLSLFGVGFKDLVQLDSDKIGAGLLPSEKWQEIKHHEKRKKLIERLTNQ